MPWEPTKVTVTTVASIPVSKLSQCKATPVPTTHRLINPYTHPGIGHKVRQTCLHRTPAVLRKKQTARHKSQLSANAVIFRKQAKQPVPLLTTELWYRPAQGVLAKSAGGTAGVHQWLPICGTRAGST